MNIREILDKLSKFEVAEQAVQKAPKSDYDDDRAVDIADPQGFNWGKIRAQGDTDYSTGDITFKKDGSPTVRTQPQKSKSAIPQTGGTFTTTDRPEEVDAFLQRLDWDPGKAAPVSSPGGTPKPPSSTAPATVTPPASSNTPATQSGQQRPRPNPANNPATVSRPR